MKSKFIKTLFLGCALAGCAFAAACADKEDDEIFVPDPGVDDNYVPSINDAYEPNRPDYDSDFDFDSGYQPAPPATEYTVEIVNSPYVSFADGSATQTLSTGEGLTLDSFKIDKAVDDAGRTLAGFGVLDENGKVTSKVAFGETAISFGEDVKITPYFSMPEEYTPLTLGSGANSKYNSDGVPGDFAAHANGKAPTYTGRVEVSEGLIVGGGKDGFAVGNGLAVYDPDPITAGSAIRFDTSYGFNITEGVYEFIYNVENRSSEVISLSIYNISASAEYKKAQNFYAYEDRYRMAVDLEPGESTIVSGQYALGSNGNALTYIIVENDISTLDLSMSLAYRQVEAEAPVNPEPEPFNNYTKVTLDLPENFTVSGYEEDQRAGRRLVVPSSDQITNNTGSGFIGWKLIRNDNGVETTLTDAMLSADTINAVRVPLNGGKLVPVLAESTSIKVSLPAGLTLEGYNTEQTAGDKLVVPTASQVKGDLGGRVLEGWYVVGSDNNDSHDITIVDANTVVESGMTIAPYFLPVNNTMLAKGEQVTFGKRTDGGGIPTNSCIDSYSSGIVNTNFVGGGANATRNNVIVGEDGFAYMGNVLSYGGTIAKGETWRVTTTMGSDKPIKKGTEYAFYFTFKNFGQNAISLSFVMVNSGTNAETSPFEVKLAPGEVKSVNVVAAYKNGSDNNNVMAYFTATDANVDLQLGVAFSMAENKTTPDPENNVTVTIDNSTYVTFASGEAVNDEISAGSALTKDMFKVSDKVAKSGRELLGFAVLDASGNVVKTVAFGDEYLVEENITITPYFSAPSGYTQLVLGSGKTNTPGYSTDGVPGDFSTHADAGEVEVVKNQLIEGGAQGFTSGSGLVITDNQAIGADSAIRLDSSYGKNITPGVYEFMYNVQNLGTQPFKFSIYNINASGEYKEGSMAYAERYAMKVELAPGESTTVKGQYLIDKSNGNALTYIVIEEDVSSLKFGMNIAYRLVDGATEPENPGEEEPAPQPETYEVTVVGGTIQGQSGTTATVEEGTSVTVVAAEQAGKVFTGWYNGSEVVSTSKTYTFEVTANITLTAQYKDEETSEPEVLFTITLANCTGITFNNGELSLGFTANGKLTDDLFKLDENIGRELSGFAVLDEKGNVLQTIKADGSFDLTEDLTLMPYFTASEGYTQLTVGSGANSGYNSSGVPGELTQHLVAGKATLEREKVIAGGANGYAAAGGVIVTDDNAVYAGSAIRFDSKLSVKAGINEFVYNVQNFGKEEISLSIFNINKSASYTNGAYDYENTYRMAVTLAPGESTTVKGQYLFDDTNGNALTYIVIEDDVSSLKFGISLMHRFIGASGELDNDAVVPYDNYVTLTLEGVTAEGWNAQQRAGRRIVLPTAEQVKSEKEIIGWQLTRADGSEPIAVEAATRVPACGGTLTPVFAEGVQVEVKLPSGLSLEGYTAEQTAGDALVVPTSEQLKGDLGGKVLEGWYNYSTKQAVTDETKVEEGLVIAPYFLPVANGTLAKGEQITFGKRNDGQNNNTYVDKPSGTAKYANFSGGGNGAVRDNLIETADGYAYLGNILSYNGTIASGDKFRVVTTMSASDDASKIVHVGAENTFYFTFKNFGQSAISLTFVMVNNGTTAETDAQTINLAPGEVKSITLKATYKSGSNNHNLMTYFTATADNVNMQLGVALSAVLG